MSRLRTILTHDVKNRFPTGDQIICDDPTMAAPPHSLGTHDRTAALTPFMKQFLQTMMEFG